MTDSPNDPKAGAANPDAAAGDGTTGQAQPSYSKPTIRRYNQIVQVKPVRPERKGSGLESRSRKCERAPAA